MKESARYPNSHCPQHLSRNTLLIYTLLPLEIQKLVLFMNKVRWETDSPSWDLMSFTTSVISYAGSVHLYLHVFLLGCKSKTSCELFARGDLQPDLGSYENHFYHLTKLIKKLWFTHIRFFRISCLIIETAKVFQSLLAWPINQE